MILKQPGIFIFALCLLLISKANGQVQQDSVQLLKTVVVKQSRLNDYVIAAYALPLDSATLALSSTGSLTDLLRKQGFGHVRSYGPGGLASPSFRGTGSSHTAVLWNGINLVSPLSGQLDLSLVPAGLFDDASIQTGGSTSLSGNGSIGANIHLNNTIDFNKGLRASVVSHLGSFHSSYYSAGIRFSNKNFGTSTNFFATESENNFKFTNRNVFPAEVQHREHSAFRQKGMLQQLHWQTIKSGIFYVKFWYQKSNYEIPNATTIVRASQATEKNEFYRSIIGWNYATENFELNYLGALIRQDLNYADPLTNQFSLSRYTSIIQNAEVNYEFKNAQLTSGIHYTGEKSDVDEFGESSPTRNRVALFGALKIDSFKQWKFALSMREEFVNGKATPLAPTLSAKYIINNVNNVINIFTTFSRNYRIATFNDLYWKGSGAQGNPDLKPELSLGGELGTSITGANITFKSVLFSNHVDNWMLWSQEGIEGWTPRNIKKVWARGAETQLSSHHTFNTVDAKLVAQYSFTMSTNENIYDSGNPNEKGKQLLLTPRHEGSLTAEGTWKKYNLRIVNTYTGEQYNDSDNTPYNIVPDYLITNLWLSKQLAVKSFSFTATAEINNVFNIDYQARPGYPLPGINFKAGIQINFIKLSKT